MPKENQYYASKGKCDADRNYANPDESEYEYKLFKKSLDEEHSRLVDCANKAFGMNSWSHSISKLDIDCIDCISGRYSVGAIAVVKVERREGAYHEELGYGCCFGLKNKIVSIAIARQDAVLNAFERAIESFGENRYADSASQGKEDVEPSFKLQKLQDKHSEKTFSSLAGSSVGPQAIALTSPLSHYSPEKVKAERKRKQQQMQEEFRRRMKLKEEPGEIENRIYPKGSGRKDNPPDDEEGAFISTQELDEMINTAVHCKVNAPMHAPLLSSPEVGGNCLWSNANNVHPR